jgi:hypothetical protein
MIDKSGSKIRFDAILFLFLSIVAVSCSVPRKIGILTRSNLFSLGMGPGEGQIDISSPNYGSFDIDMREGIFEVADSAGGRIARFSSYGDLLSMLYDPAKTSKPVLLKPVQPNAKGQNESISVGRYAAPTHFTELGLIATDSSQTIYASDRLADPRQRVFDNNSSAWCDKIIRRFGKMGMEMPYLGQEGVGGTPFPFIENITVLSDDSIIVFSASESIYLLHHFDREGNLLSLLKIPRDSLPVPKELQAGLKNNESARIDASLDSIAPFLQEKDFEVALKIDYYVSTMDPATRTRGDVSYKGSWLSILKGDSGHITNMLKIDSRDSTESIPQLIGRSRNRYFLLENQADGFIVSQMDVTGRIRVRSRIEFPKGTQELLSMKLTNDGYLYAALRTKDTVDFVWWNFG